MNIFGCCCCCENVEITEDDKNYKQVKMSYIKTNAQSGDLLLASGDGPWSRVVRWASESDIWSHVGIFIRDKEGVLHVLDIDNTTGAKLLKFDDYVFNYTGFYIGFRPLRNISSDERDKFTDILLEYWEQLKTTDYSTGIQIVKSITRRNETDDEKVYALFCTQLDIEAYRRLGLVPYGKDAELSNNSKLNDFLNKKGKITCFTDKRIFKKTIYYCPI